MRRNRFSIPIIVTSISLIAAFTWSLYYIITISRIINTAGTNNWPIVAASVENSWFPLDLKTVDGSDIKIMLPPAIGGFGDFKSFFGQDGSLYLTDAAEPLVGERIRFPNYRCRSAKVTMEQAHEGKRWWPVPMNPSARWKIEGDQDNNAILVRDMNSNETRSVPVHSILRPTVSVDPVQTISVDVSDDGNILTADIFDNLQHDLTPYGTGQLYQYRFDQGKWTHVAMIDHCVHFATNRDASMICVTCDYPNNNSVHFIDVNAGKILRTFGSAIGPVVGKRWAAYIDVGGGQKPSELVVLDMAQNWEEHRFPMPGINAKFFPEFGNLIALYEPPSDGVSGMMRGYK
jgi:hypothetical protein